MSWEPGRPLLRKVAGKYVQMPRMAEYVEPTTIYLTKHDVDELDRWMRKKKISKSKKQWNRQKEKLKKKGGEEKYV